MADKKSIASSFNDMIQADREKRKRQDLAQQMLGKNRRSSAPVVPKSQLSGSLASRVGVTKRNSSLPRNNERRPRNPRQPPSQLSRQTTEDNFQPQKTNDAPSVPSIRGAKTNGANSGYSANGGQELSIRGAAGGGPYVVLASNFAAGTTSADIESVMQNVGGEMTSCKIVASDPTVMAEMSFVEKAGAENVINTFNNKRADGRLLHVYFKTGGHIPAKANPQPSARQAEVSSDSMEVDENAESREAQDRLREERRGRDDQARREEFPSGPRYGRRDDGYYGRDRRAHPEYQDGRYGFSGGRGAGYGGGGRYRGDGRAYQDNMRSGGRAYPS